MELARLLDHLSNGALRQSTRLRNFYRAAQLVYG